MAKLQNLKRINATDFKEEDQALVEGLSYILNSFMEDVTFALNKNIDEDNLKQEVKDLEVSVDANGFPLIDTAFKNNLNVKVSGLLVSRVENLTNSTSYAPYPMIYWTEDKKIVRITNIQGLVANNKYNLRIITRG